MVKRGGTKRKIKMEKITKREYLATAFTKRCFGLHSKAAQLCLLADAQIAILATPPSSQSNVSFFSFGHSSVDAVVNAYLTGQRLAPVREEPREEDIGICMARKELGLELWWEKESLSKSKDPQELMDAINSMERILRKLRSGDFGSDEELKNDVQGTQDPDETLNLQSDSNDTVDKITEEEDQVQAICDSFCATDNIINTLSGSLDVYNEEMDHLVNVDELIDFETTFESSEFDYGVLDTTQELQWTAGRSLLKNFQASHDVSTNPNPPISVSEGVEDEALVFPNKAANDVSTNPYPIYDFEEEAFVLHKRALDEDNLQFTDYFN